MNHLATEWCGIKSWGGLIALIENRGDEMNTYIHHWLKGFRVGAYAEVNRIYTLQQTTPDFWANCKAFFDKPILPEHKSIVEAGKKAREQWRVFKSNIQAMLKRERNESGATKNTAGKEGTGGENKGSIDRVSTSERVDS